MDNIVAGLAECQSALARTVRTRVICRRFRNRSLTAWKTGKPVWAPWYTLHKIMAGLLDANQLCGNAQALEVLTNMANWVKFRVDHLSGGKNAGVAATPNLAA